MAKEVLVGQDYPIGWERAFAADIAPLMRDPRYIRINGRPMLALYRTMQIPDSAEAMRRLRAYLADAGVPDVHLIGGWLQFGNDPKLPAHPGDLGLDAYFEFPPHKMARRPMAPMATAQFAGAELELNDYNDSVDAAIDEMAAGTPSFHYRGVMGAWDNTPRRGRAMMVMHGATPTSFRRWLRATVNQARLEAQGPETAVFINAWNEWAEGANLEPDQTFGHGWLEAVASVTVREPPLQP
jgi:hypothetical protein